MSDPGHDLASLLGRLFKAEERGWQSTPLLQQALASASRDSKTFLGLLADARHSPASRIRLLSLALADPGQWPSLELVRGLNRITQQLQTAQQGSQEGVLDTPNPALHHATERVKDSYGSLLSFLHGDRALGGRNNPALRSTIPGRHITHGTLHDAVKNFSLPLAEQSGSVVAIAISNGPLLASICLAVACHYIAAPINPATSAEQFLRDVKQVGTRTIITTSAEADRLGLSKSWARVEGIQLYFAALENTPDDESENLSVKVSDAEGVRLPDDIRSPRLNKPEDVSLLLFTSGTSGAKKVVPITLHSIVIGSVLVVDSWGLTERDVCLNMMQLYHVGGIIRNIFAPIIAGGSTVCCPAFDPTLFWDVVTEPRLAPTWYYASPTMHALILEEANRRGSEVQDNPIRLVCNAAGSLLPSLAAQLRDCFQGIVLPSYGMTECMPISTPPTNYQLDRVGTSGIPTGPEIAILDTLTSEPVSPGTVGKVSLRGSPLFNGYLRPDGTIDRSAFNDQGWFDTGDTGYRDSDGYLYITGRSKEVINRGGELISPFEVEECVVAASGSLLGAGTISQALAFPVSHDVLQETVGVALVCKPGPRPDLHQLHAALRMSLQQAKWPALIVYMDDLPKRNNKIIRIGLATRLNLPTLEENSSYLERHWEATCPPVDSDPSLPIAATGCSSDCVAVERLLQSLVPEGVEVYARMAREFPGQCEAFVATGVSGWTLNPDPTAKLRTKMATLLNGYIVPRCIHAVDGELPRKADGLIDDNALHELLHANKYDDGTGSDAGSESATRGQLLRLFADVLGSHHTEIDPKVDFFSLGGDSLRAGRLLSMIRAKFKVHLPVEMVFNNQGSVANLCQYIDEHESSSESSSRGSLNTSDDSPIKPESLGPLPFSSTRPFLLAVQLLPLMIFHPMLRSVLYTAFLVTLSYTTHWSTNATIIGRLVNLTFSAFIARMVLHALAPLLCIVAKWLIIGRFKEGVYPMWSGYHTRWWLVQKLTSLTGLGLFASTNTTRVLYLRLMGARVGRNVTLDLAMSANMGEWDLLDIGDSVVLDRGVIARPFAAAPGPSMYLAPIRVGANASIGRSSVLAPGCTIPVGTCLGPNSSSWEVDSGAASEANRDLTSARQPSPHWTLTVFATWPLLLISFTISMLPYFAGIIGLVMTEPLGDNNPVYGIVRWFAAPRRVGYHVLALVLRVTCRPFIQFGFAVLTRWILNLMFGPLPARSPAKGRGHIERWRLDLQRKLLPVAKLHDMLEMFGSHYDATSTAIRLLGGKVGKRVYWPGTGPSISDYHLLDIGDDVIFGSRAHLVTSDGLGSETIRIGNGAMIADRVTVLPGVTVGEKTTLGTGAVTRRGGVYTDHATYVGSKNGDAICLSNGHAASSTPPKTGNGRKDSVLQQDDIEKQEGSTEPSPTILAATTSPPAATDPEKTTASSTSTPFGRAFHEGQASYHVLGHFTIFLYSSLLVVFTALYWNIPSIGTIQLINLLAHHPKTALAAGFWYDSPALYGLLAAFIAFLCGSQVIFALSFVAATKWLVIGRRQPGNYDWDKSSYCQRWQFFLGVERLRRSCIRGNGILALLTGTHWLVLYFRLLGAKIGRDCALFANGSPSLMLTEPDLVTLGDRVVVDDASLVAHINTRGKFDLNKLEVGDGGVLRTGSRLLSGAAMKTRAVLLEHTLVMAGDVVDEGVTMQGWPAERFKGKAVEGEGTQRAA